MAWPVKGGGRKPGRRRKAGAHLKSKMRKKTERQKERHLLRKKSLIAEEKPAALGKKKRDERSISACRKRPLLPGKRGGHFFWDPRGGTGVVMSRKKKALGFAGDKRGRAVPI